MAYVESGAFAAHKWARSRTSMWDVGHMFKFDVPATPHQVNRLQYLTGARLPLEGQTKCKYVLFLTDRGTILDDAIAMRYMHASYGDTFRIVANAARRDEMIKHLRHHNVDVRPSDDAMVAVQGPTSIDVLESVGLRRVRPLKHMHGGVDGKMIVSRTGYTGGVGAEVSGPANEVIDLVERLVKHSEVQWSGLGTRDALRLEAGLCLSGVDIGPTTTPAEAQLSQFIHHEDHIGYPHVLRHGKTRVLLSVCDASILRNGASLMTADGDVIGYVTSGNIYPGKRSLAMGYMHTDMADRYIEGCSGSSTHPASEQGPMRGLFATAGTKRSPRHVPVVVHHAHSPWYQGYRRAST